MKELATRFIDKECLIYSLDGNHQYEGIIKEVILPMIVMLIVLAIVTYVPDVVLFLPRVFMGYAG